MICFIALEKTYGTRGTLGDVLLQYELTTSLVDISTDLVSFGSFVNPIKTA